MHLQTDRLILRPFEAGDLKPFSHINADPEVMRFFPAPQTSEETAQMLAKWVGWFNNTHSPGQAQHPSDIMVPIVPPAVLKPAQIPAKRAT